MSATGRFRVDNAALLLDGAEDSTIYNNDNDESASLSEDPEDLTPPTTRVDEAESETEMKVSFHKRSRNWLSSPTDV